MAERVQVWRGAHGDRENLFGPLPGVRTGDVVAYEFELRDGNRYIFRDLYVDVIVPTDGRHYRMLDLDDYADAIVDGKLSPGEAADGLRRLVESARAICNTSALGRCLEALRHRH